MNEKKSSTRESIAKVARKLETTALAGGVSTKTLEAGQPGAWRAFNATCTALLHRASARSGFEAAHAAFELLELAVQALEGDGKALAEAAGLQAHRQGHNGPNSDPAAIGRIAHAVELAAYARLRSQDAHDPCVAVIRDTWAADLRATLAAEHGDTVPKVEVLESWIALHVPKRTKGKLTATGIVARIMLEGRLLQARRKKDEDWEDALERVVKRVDLALARS